ncbi:hypothetical protein [Nannocystis pusilla]|uniref:hypothetical protein n=1 Tax=Nannocystis pusilla TaxID=889268 RepID=UPI003BF42B6B
MRSISIGPRMHWPPLFVDLSVAAISDAEASTPSIRTPPIKTKHALAAAALDRQGRRVSGAEVRVLAFGARAADAGRTAATDGPAAFELEDLDRRSVIREDTRAGSYPCELPTAYSHPDVLAWLAAKLDGVRSGDDPVSDTSVADQGLAQQRDGSPIHAAK